MNKLALAVMWIFAFSIMSTAVGQEQNIRSLIRDLHDQQWEGPSAMTIPLQWDLQLTEPMRKILEIGPAAQRDLIANINDPAITDQVIILFGRCW